MKTFKEIFEKSLERILGKPSCSNRMFIKGNKLVAWGQKTHLTLQW